MSGPRVLEIGVTEVNRTVNYKPTLDVLYIMARPGASINLINYYWDKMSLDDRRRGERTTRYLNGISRSWDA